MALLINLACRTLQRLASGGSSIAPATPRRSAIRATPTVSKGPGGALGWTHVTRSVDLVRLLLFFSSSSSVFVAIARLHHQIVTKTSMKAHHLV